MKPHRAIAQAFGYELIKIKSHPSVDSHVSNVIKHYGIDLVFDVGANRGQFAQTLRRRGYRGEIHSFEPASKVFEQLQAACLGDRNWFAHRLALGDACGEQTMNVAESTVLSSFLDPNEFGASQFSAMGAAQRETVEVGALDSFAAEHIADIHNRRILLKMDTQGYDLKVFAGATNTVANVAFMLSELSLLPIYSEMPHYLDALRTYEERGFVVTGLYPISRKDDFSVIEMDCMMRNSKLA